MAERNLERTPEQEEALAFLRRFASIALLGLAGVAATIPGILQSIDQIGRQNFPDLPIPVLVLLSTVNPAFLVIAAAAIGALVAPRVGLTSRLVNWAQDRGGASAETSANGRALGSELGMGGIAGIATGILLLAAGALAPFPAPLAAVSEAGDGLWNSLSNALYGGLTEEVIARWGLLTLLAWALSRFRSTGEVASGRMWTAIL